MSRFVLVTGGAGYIGSHTFISLLENGFTPVIVDDFRNADERVLNGLQQISGKSILCEKVDVCNASSLAIVFQKYSFTGVIHFAAHKAVGESVAKPLDYYQNNLLGLINVLKCMLQFGVKQFVFSSSCTVYGEPQGLHEVDENTPKSFPNSPYGYTKWMGEQIIEDTFRANPELKLMSLRYFNPVGAHASGLIGEFPIGKPNNLLPYITSTAIGRQAKLTVFGNDYATPDGTCIRDYIHVMDLADAHVKALQFLQENELSAVEIINIGTGKGSSVLEIIAAFETNCEMKLNWEFGPRRPGDVTEIYANASKAEKVLGWKAKHTIADAVKDAWRWEKYYECLS